MRLTVVTFFELLAHENVPARDLARRRVELELELVDGDDPLVPVRLRMTEFLGHLRRPLPVDFASVSEVLLDILLRLFALDATRNLVCGRQPQRRTGLAAPWNLDAIRSRLLVALRELGEQLIDVRSGCHSSGATEIAQCGVRYEDDED